MTPDTDTDIIYYQTPAQGILYAVSSVQLETINIQVQTDNTGLLSDITGQVGMILHSRGGYSHRLAISFHVTVKDLGASILPENPMPDTLLEQAMEKIMRHDLIEQYGYSSLAVSSFVFEINGLEGVCYDQNFPLVKYEWYGGSLLSASDCVCQ